MTLNSLKPDVAIQHHGGQGLFCREHLRHCGTVGDERFREMVASPCNARCVYMEAMTTLRQITEAQSHAERAPGRSAPATLRRELHCGTAYCVSTAALASKDRWSSARCRAGRKCPSCLHGMKNEKAR